jgi:hypothetical protein
MGSMTTDEIIRMAQEARLWDTFDDDSIGALERFAALVATAEREAIKWNSIHSCHADCQNPACVIVREAVEAERESCAKVLDRMAENDKLSNYFKEAAFLIRERGQA